MKNKKLHIVAVIAYALLFILHFVIFNHFTFEEGHVSFDGRYVKLIFAFIWIYLTSKYIWIGLRCESYYYNRDILPAPPETDGAG